MLSFSTFLGKIFSKDGIPVAAMILAEIGDFSNFESPDKILAYAAPAKLFLDLAQALERIRQL